MDGIGAGSTKPARRRHRGGILISCVRNFGVEPALRMARFAAERPHPYVVGFSMADDEETTPPPTTPRRSS